MTREQKAVIRAAMRLASKEYSVFADWHDLSVALDKLERACAALSRRGKRARRG